MEQLSDEEREELSSAGAALEASAAWMVARSEIDRMLAGIVQSALAGKLETYEEYLAKRAEYVALLQLRALPGMMQETGAP